MKKTLLTFLFFGGIFNSQAQWIDQPTNGAQSRGVRNITIVNDKTAWATLYDGSGNSANIQELYKTVNGQTWRVLTVTAASGAYGIANVSALDTTTAWISVYPAASSTAKQGVYKTTNGGATWTKVSGNRWGASSFLNVVYFWDANYGVALGDPVSGNYQLEVTTDGGATWTSAQTTVAALSSSEYGYVGVFDVVGDLIWYGTNTGRILYSYDRGMNWSVVQTPLSDIQEVKFFSPSWGFARQIDNTNGINDLIETLDSGKTWNPVIPSGNFYTAGFDIMPQSGVFISTGAAQGASGTAYSLDSCRTWVDLETGFQRLDVAFYSDSIGWAGAFSSGSGTNGILAWDPSYNGVVTSTVKNNIAKGTIISVYPNPNKGTFVVDFKGNLSNQTTIKVINLVGEEVYKNTLPANYWTRHSINLENASKGIYFVEVTDGTQEYISKIVME